MKENWMNKLIELLNQFEVEKWENSAHWQTMKARRREWHIWQLESIFGTLMSERESRLSITSKSYWFIKWLVENDKIDTQNLITYMKWTNLTFNKVPSTDWVGIDKIWNKFYTETLLMLLSISDTPIEDLISYLE